MFAADGSSLEFASFSSLTSTPHLLPPALHEQIRLDDETISLSLRKGESTPEELQEQVTRFVIQDQLEQAFCVVREGGRFLEHAVSSIGLFASYLAPSQKAVALRILCSCEVDANLIQSICAVVGNLTLTHATMSNFIAELGEPTFFKLLSLLPSSEAREVLAESWVRTQLQTLVSQVEDPEARAALSAPGAGLRDLLSVFDYLPPEKRIHFLSKLISLQKLDDETKNFIIDKIDNLVHSLSSSDKAKLSEISMERGNMSALAAILSSSSDLEELVEIIEKAGTHKLLTQGKEVREIVSSALLLQEARSVDFSEMLQGADNLGAEEYAAMLRAKLQEIEAIVHAHSELKDTKIHAQLSSTVKEDLEEIEDILRASPESEKTRDDLYAAAFAAALEFRYGVNLRGGESDYLKETREQTHLFLCPPELHDHFDLPAGEITGIPRWNLEMLKEVEEVLAGIPELHLVLSDMLHEIELVDSLGMGVLGVRYHADGKIKIARVTFKHDAISESYDGKSSLVMVLAHEIGHGIQIGNGQAGFELGAAGWDFGNGESRYDFDEFRNIASWQVIGKSRFELGNEYGVIVVDGIEHHLGVPEEHRGETLIFRYVGSLNVLIAHNPEAEFSKDPYSQASPWEDFAEAFAEYLFLPERLIQHAPHKFKLLDEEFGKYRDNSAIRALVEETITRQKEKNSQPGTPGETPLLFM